MKTVQDFTTHGLNRLTTVTGPVVECCSFDAATNIASRSGPNATYTHDQANRVTSDGTRSFVWDGADRLTQRGTDTFSYDPLARLTSATIGSGTSTYAYDGDGLLQLRTDAASTTTFVWDPSVAPAPLLDVGTDRVVHGLGPLYVARGDGSTSSLVRDALGSVRAELDDLGLVTKSFRYAAYGAISDRTAVDATPTLFGFTGELVDPSGLTYLRARWYDPSIGRFLVSDVVSGDAELPATLNTYAYATGSPVRWTDPSGRCGVLITVCIGAIVGAVTGAAGAVGQGGSLQQVLVATAVGAASGAVLGIPSLGGRVVVGAGIGAFADLTGQLIVRPELGSVNWGSVAGAALGGALATYGARATLRIGEALQADRWTREWAAGLIGVGPSGALPLLGGAFWDALWKVNSSSHVGADYAARLPGTLGTATRSAK